jgi:hypothetical protein
MASQTLEALEIHGQFTYTLENEQVVILDLRARNRVEIVEHSLTNLYILSVFEYKCISFEKMTQK